MKRRTIIRKISSLAFLIFTAHSAGAMERHYDQILREIEELTARIHREVDKVLADYKRDTAEYHRRMGVKKGMVSADQNMKRETEFHGQAERGRRGGKGHKRWQNIPEEERKRWREKRREMWENMTEEEKQRWREKRCREGKGGREGCQRRHHGGEGRWKRGGGRPPNSSITGNLF